MNLIYIASPLALRRHGSIPCQTLLRIRASEEAANELRERGYTLTFTQARLFAYTLKTQDAIPPFASLDGFIDESSSDTASIIRRYSPMRAA